MDIMERCPHLIDQLAYLADEGHSVVNCCPLICAAMRAAVPYIFALSNLPRSLWISKILKQELMQQESDIQSG